MAMKLKTGADLCGLELLRARLQNNESDITEYGAGTIYFNTSASGTLNSSNRIRYRDNDTWRSVAHMDDITALKEQVDLILGGEIDADGIIENWKEVEAFLAGISDTQDLVTLLNSKLDKSGGTINGSGDFAYVQLRIKGSSIPNIMFEVGSSEKGAIGWTSNEGMRLTNTASSSYLGIKDNGTPHFNDNTLIHSGNIGSYAIAFDNSTSKGYASPTKYNTVGYGNAIVDEGWHTLGPILTFGRFDYFGQFQKAYNGNSLYLRSYVNGSFTDWKTIAFTDSNVASAQALTHSNGTVGVKVTSAGALLDKDGYQIFSCGSVSGETYTRFQAFGAPDSAVATVLEGGGAVILKTSGTERLFINSSGNVLIGTTEDNGAKLYVDGNVTCSYLLANNSIQAGRAYTYSTYIDGASDGGRIGVLKNGVHSATLLNIQEDGKGLFHNTILANNINAIQFVYGNYGVVHRNDGSSYYILLTDYGNSSGAFNSLRPFAINLTTGNVTLGHNLSVSGNVGIGATNPSEKLHVVGNVYVDGNIIATGQVSAGGVAEEGTTGGGTVNKYSTYVETGVTNKTIYHGLNDSAVNVAIYEETTSGTATVWNMVLTDVEIIDANNVKVRFGTSTTVRHLIVIV